MRVVVFTGAGSSVELGVPAMQRMAQGFRRHVHDWEIEQDLVGRLMPESSDIEDLIEQLDRVCGARGPLQTLGLDDSVLDGALTVQAEVEWYVQHTCERLSPELAALQWGSLLEVSSTSHQLVVATTNYDRAVELAANSLGVKLLDGFAAFERREIAPWVGFSSTSSFTSEGVTLLKLHGSTDWYELDSTGDAVKLRHPMPLFANGSLHLPSIQDALRASLILPSREKRVTRPPYLRLSQVFLNAVDESDTAIFLGTSLRDPHIRQAAVESANVRPTFFVGRSPIALSAAGSVIRMTQSASQFLISTLPYALNSTDPIGVLKTHAVADSNPGDSPSLLALLATSLDSSAPTRVRCESIEELERANLPLSNHVVERLIRDSDSMVARFGLGLVPLAMEGSALLAMAQRSEAAENDSKYKEELELLLRLMDELNAGDTASHPRGNG